MRKQKGQTLVEFALIIPFFFAMCFGMIYGGILFLDYLQYNNASRSVARMISLTTNETERNNLKRDFENNTSEHIKQLTNLYTANPKVTINSDAGTVTVSVGLTLNQSNLPALLDWIKFPPKNLNPITIVMPLERAKE